MYTQNIIESHTGEMHCFRSVFDPIVPIIPRIPKLVLESSYRCNVFLLSKLVITAFDQRHIDLLETEHLSFLLPLHRP